MIERLSEDINKKLSSRNRFTRALRVINIATCAEAMACLEQVIVQHSGTAGEMALLTGASSACLYFFLEYSKAKGKELESQLITKEKRKNEDLLEEKPKRFSEIDGELIDVTFDEDDYLHFHNHR